jgi:hypothetical protein
MLYSAVAATHLKVPLTETGAFRLVAWQIDVDTGLWLGSSSTSGERPLAFPRWVVLCAVAVALYAFAWRHFVGQQPSAKQCLQCAD